MKFFIDGMQCQESDALETFTAHYLSQGGEINDVAETWNACLLDEGARDDYLPSYLELAA
jgi:hypothetical protein